MTAAIVLLCQFFVHMVGAMTLVPSRAEHDGSVSIVGPNRTSRSHVDAAINCLQTADCRGIWFHDDRPHGISQAGVCPAEPYKSNNVLGQTQFYFEVMGHLKKGELVHFNVLSCQMFQSATALFSTASS